MQTLLTIKARKPGETPAIAAETIEAVKTTETVADTATKEDTDHDD
jgi:hypothetical protein